MARARPAQRRSFLRGAGLAGALGTATAGGLAALATPSVQAGERLRWRLASSFPRNLDVLFGSVERMAVQVRKMTGGRFDISIHEPGELAPAFGVLEAVQGGSVEMAFTAPAYFQGRDETFALDCAIPFGLNARQMNAWLLEGEGLALLREFYAGQGIVNYPGGNTGAQMGGWYRKEIKTVEDLKGLRMRIGGLGGRVLSRLGVGLHYLPAGETVQALEKGVVDAAEWGGPHDDQILGFNRAARLYYSPGWWAGGANLSYYIGRAAWDGLSVEFRSCLEAAMAQAATQCLARYDQLNPLALRQLLESGVEVHAFPREVIDAAFKTAVGLYDELNQRNANWRRIFSSLASYRRDANAWFRLSEAQFDQIMQRQRL